MPVNTADLGPGGTVNAPLGLGSVTGLSSVSVVNQVSVNTLSVMTWGFSIQTAAAATAIGNNSLGLVFRASGISLVYVSGGTVYSFGSSGVGSSFASGLA